MTVPMHHIEGDMIVAYAAGTLSEGLSLVVAAHLSYCPKCRMRVATAEAVGGAVLEEMTPEPVSQDKLAAVLGRLDEPEAAPTLQACANAKLLNTSLPGCVRRYLPADLDTIQWGWSGPGVKHVQLLREGDIDVSIYHCKSGISMIEHDHVADEAALILSGGFSDAKGSYRRGDFQIIEAGYVHAPVVDTSDPCLCLVLKRGPTKLTGRLPRLFQKLFGP